MLPALVLVQSITPDKLLSREELNGQDLMTVCGDLVLLQAVAVASVGGAAASSSMFAAETYAILFLFPAQHLQLVDSVSAVVDSTATVSSTADIARR